MFTVRKWVDVSTRKIVAEKEERVLLSSAGDFYGVPKTSSSMIRMVHLVIMLRDYKSRRA
ncbi:MAG: hypothetical protein AAGI25_17430 [Bacteroidota bacterium]